MRMPRRLHYISIGLLLSACGSKSVVTNSTVSGISVPKEISAVPPKGSGATALQQGLSSSSAALESDLSSAQTVKFVDEQELNRGDILKSIFGALEQTHYADAENIGAGPYKSMVSFVDDHGDGQQKSLQMWTVSSSIISDPSDGQPVNQVLAWIPQTMGDSQTPVVIRAVVKIKKAPTKNADGSYADAGVWTLNAKFVDDASQFFAAEATVDSSGRAVIKMHQAMQDGPAGTLHEEKAYMV